jgi:hypothetical protein
MVYTAQYLNFLCVNRELEDSGKWVEKTPERIKKEMEIQESMLFKTVLGEMIDVKYTLTLEHILKIVVAVTIVFSRKFNVK